MLKFDPFALKITSAAWPKNAKNNNAFYKLKQPSGVSRKQFNMVEHAIIETGSEREAISLNRLVASKQQQQVFCSVVHAYQVTIDDYPLNLYAAETLLSSQ